MTEKEKIMLRGLDYRYKSAGMTKSNKPRKDRSVCFLVCLEQMDVLMQIPSVKKAVEEAIK
jgi:hypothetical protein